jgi:hypothetical protein
MKFESKFVRVEINANLHNAAEAQTILEPTDLLIRWQSIKRANLEKSGDMNTMAKIPTFKRSIREIEVTVGFNVPFVFKH